MRTKTWLLLVFVHCACVRVAFSATPVVQRTVPLGCVPGAETLLTLRGQNLHGPLSLWTSFRAESLLEPAKETETTDTSAVRYRIKIPAESPPGIGALRLVTTNGVSAITLVLLDNLPVVSEAATNETMDAAQALSSPIAMDGMISELKMDYFKISAREGQWISVETVAQRLGSRLDSVIRILDAPGHELAYCDDDPPVGTDSRVRFRAPRGGDYWIEVRDINYEGGPEYYYRLRLGDFPLSSLPYPPAGVAGTKSERQILGSSVEPLKKVEVDFPIGQRSVRIPIRFPNGKTSAFLTAEISDGPEEIETEPNDTVGNGTPVPWPCFVNGRLERDGDRDYYTFEAKKDQKLVVRAQTRSLGSPCDLFLQLQDDQGKTLAEADVKGADEGTITNRISVSGSFRLMVEELNRRGGADYAYRIAIDELKAGFELEAGTNTLANTLSAAPGGTVELKVSARRRDYDGPITVRLSNAAEAFALEDNLIPEKKTETTLKIHVPESLQPGDLVLFEVIGTARIGEADVRSTATTIKALRARFPKLDRIPGWLDRTIALGVK